jgi:steroid delta-isomerase-like uncharacterized protein
MALAYANDAELTVIPGAGTLQGRDAIAADWKPFFQAFPDLRFALSRAWLTGDVAVAEFVDAGTNSGDFLGIKATGRMAGQTSAAVLWFDAQGLIAREHLYEDGLTMLAQLSGQPGAPPVPTIPEKSEVVFADGSQVENDALAVGRRYIDALQRRDATALLDLLAPDFELDLAMAAAPERGKDAARQAYERFAAAFPDARFDVTGRWAAGDYAIFEYAVQGTQQGPLGGLPATHRQADWHWLRILEGKNGAITRAWGFANMIELMGQLGALPGKGGAPPTPAGTQQPPAQRKPPAPGRRGR